MGSNSVKLSSSRKPFVRHLHFQKLNFFRPFFFYERWSKLMLLYSQYERVDIKQLCCEQSKQYIPGDNHSQKGYKGKCRRNTMILDGLWYSREPTMVTIFCFFTNSFLWKLTLKGNLVRTGHSKYGGLTKSYPENVNTSHAT